MKNIHILPTDKPSRLVKIYNDVNKENFTLKLDVEVNDSFKEYLNIYITSDKEIKEGDWRLDIRDNNVYKSSKEDSMLYDNTFRRKIILTTDQDLIKDGIQAIDDEFLEWFMEDPYCEYVDTEEYCSAYLKSQNINYKIIIPDDAERYADIHMEKFDLTNSTHLPYFHNDREKIKNAFRAGVSSQQERDKDKFTVEEARGMLIKFHNEFPNRWEIDNWFEQFKKK